MFDIIIIYSIPLKIALISGNDVVTPSQLVAALKYFGGLQNSIVELIKLDRETVSKLEDNFAECDRKLKKIIKRTNDVFFSYADSTSTNDISTSSYQGNYMPPFSLQGYEYSGRLFPNSIFLDIALYRFLINFVLLIIQGREIQELSSSIQRQLP